ncbi:hypothetical protein [Bradyrhizobium sp.]|uniref:hypothetical protein n=1 Tax=Bradyrhizobium sp. TaxID=376 RepID=UPI003C70767E
MIAVVEKIRQLWRRAFFSAEPALNLAAARVIFAVHALWVLLSRDIPAMSALPPEFWAYVDRTELWRYFIVPGHAGLEHTLQWIAVAALVCVILGLMPRLACFVSALLLYHLAPLETLYWTANPFQRGFTISVLALVTLSFSRCGDALRLGGAPAVAPSPDYCWPLRLIQFHLANVYFLSGVSKLIRVGFSWLDPQNLREWFLLFSQQDQVIREAPIFNILGPWFADHAILCAIAGLYGVVANICFLAAPFSRYARRFLVPDAIFFHTIVFFSMNIFWNNIIQLLIYVNWSWLVTWLKKRLQLQRTPNVWAQRHS